MGEYMHTAKLITILSVEEGLKTELAHNIRVRASLENRVLKKEDTIAVLNIVGTTSYQVFFIDDRNSLDVIKSELDKMGVLLNYDSEKILQRYIQKKMK